MRNSIELQKGVQNWWEENPMTYDWRKTIPYEEGTLEFYQEIDRRFWQAAWFAHKPGEEPFNRLVDYERVRDKKVLEIGCGAGALSAQLAKNGANLTAVDLTQHGVDLTRRRFELFNLKGDIRQMDAEHLAFPDASFDYVWSWGVIHHSANTETIIAQIHRVLKPGGEARIMVYHRNSIVFRLGHALIRGVLMGKLRKQTLQEIADEHTDGLIAKYYTPENFAAKFKQFQDVQTEVCGQKVEVWQIPASSFKDALVRMTPDALAWWLTRRYGMYLFLRATKPKS